MKAIEWQATTSGKSVFRVFVDFGNNQNPVILSVVSKRAARWILDDRQLRRCVKFETPFQFMSDFAVIGFQPETGYMTAVKLKNKVNLI